MATEFERIARLGALFAPAPHGVEVGIGDDAAVLVLPAFAHLGDRLVWTVDSCVDQVHFRRDIASWQDVGWRSFMAAASDIAAMGAHPLGALSALMLSDLQESDLDELAQGQNMAARSIGTAVIGGNLSRGGEVSVTTTLLGITARAPGRSGARAGDLLILAGQVGLAGAGLRLLLRDGASWTSTSPAQTQAVAAWRRPVARIEDGLRCASSVSSLIDVSDGVAQDAGHLAEASHVRIEIDGDALLSPSLEEVCRDLGCDPLQVALCAGEDYALLGTCAVDAVPEGFRVIGRVAEGQGVCLSNGELLSAQGHDHFRKS